MARSTAAGAEPGVAAWAHLAGLWHDLGKFRPGFQKYVRQEDDAHIEGKGVAQKEKSHSAAGALHALKSLTEGFGKDGERAGWLLAHLIAAHHAGLYDKTDLDARLRGSDGADSEREWREAVQACARLHPDMLALPGTLDARSALLGLPGLVEREELAQALGVRMLFSALVDADFLDTERYLNPGKAQARTGFPPLCEYRDRLDRHLDALAAAVQAAGRADDSVMRARSRVLADCRTAATGPPGVYSLQVPTGCGKTFASLAFALAHAVAHELDRVIVAIPYTSIVEQTADQYAQVFGADALVEHHSQVEVSADQETRHTRLACENWDAPLIVTTNVQLFESLFAARTSRCRKLHNLRRSVIILDEAQTLPPEFRQPTFDALRLLVRHYGATLVSCTATQPVLTDIRRFDPRQNVRGLTRDGERPRDIVADAEALYAALERVRLEWPASFGEPVEIPEIAERIAAKPCVLAIVNTRKDAAELCAAVDAVGGERCIYLSAAMCGQHRADCIARIRIALEARRNGDPSPLRVISTQLVEAGVDLDFPVVFRALAGLDSIAQAAGRCNREGRLGPRGGRVVMFRRPLPRLLDALVKAEQATISVLGNSRPEALGPEHFTRYFERWYGDFEPDRHGINTLLRASPEFALSFRSAADAFRLIPDQGLATLVVPHPAELREQALNALRSGHPDRWVLRALQRFVVQARERDVRRWQSLGDVSEPLPGWFVLENALRYDSRLGLLREDAPLAPDELVF
ncbi:MAG: hypothetical protein AMXMBFR25_27390 [Lysobacterales bacterium]